MEEAKSQNGVDSLVEYAAKISPQGLQDIKLTSNDLKQGDTRSGNVNIRSPISKPVSHRKAITVEVIAQLKSVDNVDFEALPILDGERESFDGLQRGLILENKPIQRRTTDRDEVIRTVEIIRARNEPLGFFIRQGDGWGRKDGIFVSRITPGSLFDCRGSLKVGDEILELNGVSLAGFSLHDVVQLIQIPKRLILTVKISNKPKRPRQKLSKRQRSAPDMLSSIAKTEDWKHVTRRNENNPSCGENQKQTTGCNEKVKQRNICDYNSNTNELHSNSTVDDLIDALRLYKHGDYSDSEENTEKSENRRRHKIAASAFNGMEGKPEENMEKGVQLNGNTVPQKRASTLTPATTVNLVFDDEDYTIPESVNTSVSVQEQKRSYRREQSAPLLRTCRTDAETTANSSTRVSSVGGYGATGAQERSLPVRSKGRPYETGPETEPVGMSRTNSTVYTRDTEFSRTSATSSDTSDSSYAKSLIEISQSKSQPQKSPYRRGPDFIAAVKSTTRSIDSQQFDKVTVITPPGAPRSLPNSRGSSPGGSPKPRRRLPSIPGSIEGDALQRDTPGIDHSGKKLLSVPGGGDGRKHRKLPTPPSSPLADRKTLASPARRDSSWSSGQSSDAESAYSQSPGSDKSGSSLSQLIKKAGKSLQSDFKSKKVQDKNKSDQEEKKHSRAESAPRSIPYKRSQSAHCADFFEQQRHSMLLHSYAYGNMQPTANLMRTLPSENTIDVTGITVTPRPRVGSEAVIDTKPINDSASPEKPRARLASNYSPSFFRRASSSLLLSKFRSSHASSESVNDNCQIQIERQPGFLVYPDDYVNEDLNKSHAVSGMVQVRIVKAINLPLPDRKKKRVYCAIEVDFERKAFTSSKKASKNLTWDEIFEVEIQHGREMCLACSTSDNHEFDKPVARILFFLAPLVRCGQTHQMIFRLQPSGFLQVELEFTELKTLLKRVQSSKTTGVFGFCLNVTSELERSSVPLLVRKCVEEIEKRGLDSVGLYRISGNARRKKELRCLFDDNSESVDITEGSWPDINVITGILKDYLRELPQPLITEKMTEGLMILVQENMHDKDPGTQKRALSKLLGDLPETNRYTLIFILNHLRNVVSKKEMNRMDVRNLSVCLAPVLQCSPTNLSESKDLLDLKLYLKTVEVLLQMWCNMDYVA